MLSTFSYPSPCSRVNRTWCLTWPIVFAAVALAVGSTPAAGQSPQQIEQIVAGLISVDPEAGTCDIDYTLTVPTSPLAAVYRRFFGFPPSGPTEIPAFVMMAAEHTINDVYVTTTFEYQEHDIQPTPVRSQVLQAFMDLHRHHFGILVDESDIQVAEISDTGSEVVLHIEATGVVATVEGAVFFGPQSIEESFDRMGYLIFQMDAIQTLLKEDPDFDTYHRTWQVALDFGDNEIQNDEDLDGKSWSQQFGPTDGDNQVEAQIMLGPDPTSLVLMEDLELGEGTMTTSPNDLYQDGFHCFKTFPVELDSVGLPLFSSPYNPLGGGITWDFGGFDCGYNIALFPGAELSLEQGVGCEFGVSWDFGWFDLNEFETYLQIDASAAITLNVDLDDSFVLEVGLVEWKRPYVFMVYFVPVEVTLGVEIGATAELGFSASHQFSYTALVQGTVRAGMKWDEDDGWSKIREHDFDITSDNSVDWGAGTDHFQVRLGLPVTLSALFYESAGPTATITPALRLLRVGPDCGQDEREISFDLDLDAGIAFDGPLQSVFELEDYAWDIADVAVWKETSCGAGLIWDVSVTDLVVPPRFVINELVEIEAAVANTSLNTLPPDTADILLNVTVADGQDVLFDFDFTFLGLPAGSARSHTFVWDTQGLPLPAADDLVVTATASLVNPDPGIYEEPDQLGNNEKTSLLPWNVEEIGILNVSSGPGEVPPGDPVSLDVIVENHPKGLNTHDVLVLAYVGQEPDGSDGTLISNIWCESSWMIFDLEPGSSDFAYFSWDTQGAAEGDYHLSAQIPVIPLEYDPSNNFVTDPDPVTLYEPLCGDANGDGSLNTADAIYMLTAMFIPGSPQPDPVCIADVDGSGSMNVADPVYLLAYLFSFGPEPVPGCCSL